MVSPSEPTPVKHRLARSAGGISLATAASRVLGFVRDMAIARLFGTGVASQAFVVAFRLPNLFRDLVAEGAVTSAVVPVLAAYRSTKSREEFWELAQALCVRVLVAVSVLGFAGSLLAPWLVRLVAPGFASQPELFELTVWLTRVMFPFITLVGLWAFFCGLLNSLHSFVVPALGPAMLNLVMIVSCVAFVPNVDPPVLGLAWGVLLGGVVQLLMQLPLAWRAGFRWRWAWRHPGSREVMRLLTPRLVGAAVYQVSVLFDTILASIGMLAGAGAVAALYFANRLVQLPLALFATASAQASLPLLSERAAVRDYDAFRSTMLSVLRVVVFESLPAAVGLIVFATPIVQLCFERGAFDQRSTAMTARTLACFSLGLVAYAASKVLAGAFYALHDTRTPVRLAIQALVTNMALAVVLVWPLQISGLALATALSNSVNAWRMLRHLERKLGHSLAQPLAGPVARMGVAAAAMGISCVAIRAALMRFIPTAAALILTIGAGVLVYGLGCYLLHVEELLKGLRWINRLRTTQSSANA